MRWLRKIFSFIFKFKKEGIYYIGGSEILPAPLSKEEELIELISLENGNIEARNTLIEHNLRLVVYIAKKYEYNGNIEDLISIGTIGLVKAINTFKLDKNIKLATYASRCIENEILMYLRKTNKIKTEVSFDEPLNVDYDGNELLLSDIIGTESDLVNKEIEENEQKKLIREALQDLKARERQILIMRFGLDGKEELTQKDVADLLGISQSYISRLEKRIIRKLRNKLNKAVL